LTALQNPNAFHTPYNMKKRIYRALSGLMELPCYRTTQAKSERFFKKVATIVQVKKKEYKVTKGRFSEKNPKTNYPLIEHLFQQYACEVK
jgi:hypothetical protein